MALLGQVLKEGDSVIDVGAQLGYVTAHMARQVGPSGRVHSFEPDPTAVERLRASVEANAFTWVSIFPMAASDRDEELTLNVTTQLGWSTAIEGTHYHDTTPIRVRGTRIDALLDAARIARPVAFVKIDVEGFEVAVLDGMQALIAQIVRTS